jgi:hypothetical protein
MTVAILEHARFLQVKGSFRAYRTKLAFSNLATRRICLSSDVFQNLDTAMGCIPHELGHFVPRSMYEDHAEIAAGAIRESMRLAPAGCACSATRAVFSIQELADAGRD